MKRILTALATAILFTGCASQRPYGAALNEYLPFTGPPVREFHFWDLYSWEAVGPNQLVLWATPWEAYFVTVGSPCFDLEWTHRLGVTSTAGTVSHFEWILVGHHDRCQIIEIRPIDTKQLKVARKQRSFDNAAGKDGAPPAAQPAPPPPAVTAPATPT